MAALEVELKMLGSDGIAPKDTFVSMRVGDSQKQSRLQASRTFKFAPGVADLRGPFGRIEVFKRVGSATVGLSDPTEVQVDCGEGDLKWLRFQVQASGVSSTTANKDSVSANKPQSQAAKERVDEARKYLEEHRLEELIASAMREIIRLRPSEPHKFLCDQIMGLSAAQRKGKENSVPPPPPVPKAEAVDVADLRQQAKAVLLGAAESGALKTALSQKQSVANAKVPDTEELRQQAKAEPMQKEPLSPAGLRPSVGTWLSPRPKRVAHAAESATPAPAATEPPVFALRPSVGSWLAPRPRPFLAAQVSTDTTEQAKPFVLKPSVGTWLMPPKPNLQVGIRAAPTAEESHAKRPFVLHPSVGTWLAPRPAAAQARSGQESSSSARPFALRPSVGTWLMGKPSVEAAAAPAPAPAPAMPATSSSREPLVHKPSAGWLMKKPHQVEKPWYYKELAAEGPAAHEIKELQVEIAKRDQELNTMRQQLITLRDTIGADKFVELGLTLPMSP
eukprot:TRINITY_DN19264_c0_g4_i1.p1 TRINITY_DN19264_c0_g4~~TRINITY_DN19264_c0_g4_i1.p1  ORF type:complete len:505 (+),score=131.11 TRINITY_DN19264_c0_g4_i1:74-1588(+)